MPATTALVMTGPQQVQLRALALPEPTDTQVIVRTDYSVVSSGTELRCLAGRQGDGKFPFVPGYSAAGVVVQAGRASGCREGQRVFCGGSSAFVDMPRQWGGHASHMLSEGAAVIPLPDGVSTKQAALAKIAAIAYHGFRLTHVKAEDRVVVLGLGLLGQLSARLFAAAARTTAADPSAQRVQAASAAGVEAMLIDHDLQPLLASCSDSADVVVDVTGVAAVMAKALDLLRARPWGDVTHYPPLYLVQGSYAHDMSIPYAAAFSKEAIFLLSRDNGRDDLEAVLAALAQRRLSVDDLLVNVVSPADAQRVYEQLAGRGAEMTAVFEWASVA